MNKLSIRSCSLGLSLGLSLAVTPASAKERWVFEDIRVSDIPVIEVEPDVAWKDDRFVNGAPMPLLPQELTRPSFDGTNLPKPKLTNGNGNAAVVRIRDLYLPENHGANGWLRFLQSDSAPPATMVCGPNAGSPRGVDTHLLEASHPEGPRFTHTELWLDGTTCKGLLLRHYTTAVKPLFGGVAFAYRAHCASCTPEQREMLHIIFPTGMRSSAFGENAAFHYWTYLMEHLSIPLARGTAGTMTASIEESSIVSWNRILSKPAPVRDIELRIETSFGAGEDEPTLVAASRGAVVHPLPF